MFSLNTIITLLGGHLLLNNFFQKQYQNLIMNSSFYLILVYSKCEYYLKKINNNKYFLKLKNLFYYNKNKNSINIIKNNVVIDSCNRDNFNEKNMNCDFIIYSDYDNLIETNNNFKKVNKVIYYKNSSNEIDYNYKICNFNFISINIELQLNDNTRLVSIKLSNDTENYYIVGNRINKLLIGYFIKNLLHLDDNEKYTYKLILIDNNANIKMLTEEDEIILSENDYSVI